MTSDTSYLNLSGPNLEPREQERTEFDGTLNVLHKYSKGSRRCSRDSGLAIWL